MSKLYSILFITAVFGLTACSTTKNLEEKISSESLIKQREAIIKFAKTDDVCNDGNEWSFIALGTKACGGPVEFIAYKNDIDEEKLTDMVEKYTKNMSQYNTENNIASDCMLVMPPQKIVCENGKATFVYE